MGPRCVSAGGPLGLRGFDLYVELQWGRASSAREADRRYVASLRRDGFNGAALRQRGRRKSARHLVRKVRSSAREASNLYGVGHRNQ